MEGSGPSPVELGITQKDLGIDKPAINPTQTTETKNQRLAIREFTKSTPEGKQARGDAARDILGLRAGAKELQQQQGKSLTEGQAANEQNLTNAEAKKIEAENQVLTLRAQLTDRSTSWLARARAFVSGDFRKETQNLQKQLPKLEDKLESETGYLKVRQELYQENLVRLERQFAELSQWYQTHPQVGKETLQNFYAIQGQLLKKYQEGAEMKRQKEELEAFRQEHGTVAEITDKYQGYIVHGITPGFGGTNNLMLEETASWQDKLMAIMVERPPLSGHFIKLGNGPQYLWSPIGIVFKDGIVAEAHAGDAASLAVDKKTKTTSMSPTNIERYQAGLERAVARNNVENGYNEIITEFGATPGGFYINLDQGGNTQFDNKGIAFKDGLRRYEFGVPKERLDRIEYADIFATARFVGLPVVVIKDGVVYESSLDPSSGGLMVGKRLSPEEVISTKTEILNENLAEIQKRSRSVLKTAAIV